MSLLENRIRIVKLTALFASVMGLLVLFGWKTDVIALKSVSPQWASMKPNTAVCLVLIGGALLLSFNKSAWATRWKSGMAMAMAAAVIGGVTVTQDLFGWDLGIDQVLFSDRTDEHTLHPGRMAPMTALAFVMLGIAILLLKRRPIFSQWMAVTTGFISVHVLVGYLYHVEEFYGLASFSDMAAHTAALLLTLSFGILMARIDAGPAQFLSGDTVGANLFRRLWWVAVGTVLVIGYVRLKVEELGLSEPQFATGLLVVIVFLIVSALLWRTAHGIDRADAQRRLRERELKEFFEGAPFGMDVLSDEGITLLVNETECHILGYPREELLGRPLSDLTLDKELAFELLQRCRNEESVRDFEMMLRRKDGTIAHVLVDANVQGEPGQPIRITKSMQDITARRTAERQLDTRQRQQEALATLGNFAAVQPDLQVVFDFASNIIAQTLQVEHCKLLKLLENKREFLLVSGVGWKEGSVGKAIIPAEHASQAGYTFSRGEPVIVPDLRTEARFKAPSLLIEHGIISGMSVGILHGEEKYGVLGAHTKQLRIFTRDDANFLQAAAHILGSAIRGDEEMRLRKQTGDLTERSAELENEIAKRTAELRDTISFLERFLYSIAHDLRAPLRAMQGITMALREDYGQKLDETGKDYTERIVSSCERMDKLVLDLLDYGRLSHVELPREAIEVGPLVEQVLNDIVEEVAHSRAQVTVAQPLPIVWANGTMFRQVLSNLLSNALKYVAPGKTPKVQISAEVRKDGRTARINVQDDGIGIEPSLQNRIFRPFERLHTVEQYPGTGIGLAIVQQAIERMGGRVGVKSELGKGSCFWVELPTVADKTDRARELQPVPEERHEAMAL